MVLLLLVQFEHAIILNRWLNRKNTVTLSIKVFVSWVMQDLNGAQHDGVRTTMKKSYVHPKFFQNPFLGCPWVVGLGIRT